MPYINKHTPYGLIDDEDVPSMKSRNFRPYNRIMAALAHPDAPETIDGFTEREKMQLAKHIALRLAIPGPK
jgi:hypothetical protein